jgi:hypothetical protein
MAKFLIEPYGPYDKRIRITGPAHLDVDNDDVWTEANMIVVERMIDILNEHWTDIKARRCNNEDCEECWNAIYELDQPICPACSHATEIFTVEAA